MKSLKRWQILKIEAEAGERYRAILEEETWDTEEDYSEMADSLQNEAEAISFLKKRDKVSLQEEEPDTEAESDETTDSPGIEAEAKEWDKESQVRRYVWFSEDWGKS